MRWHTRHHDRRWNVVISGLGQLGSRWSVVCQSVLSGLRSHTRLSQARATRGDGCGATEHTAASPAPWIEWRARAGPTRSGTPSRCRRAAARRTITPTRPASGEVGSSACERGSPVRHLESPREECRWSAAERSCHLSPAAWPPRDGLSRSRRPRRSRSMPTSGPI